MELGVAGPMGDEGLRRERVGENVREIEQGAVGIKACRSLWQPDDRSAAGDWGPRGQAHGDAMALPPRNLPHITHDVLCRRSGPAGKQRAM